MGAERVESWYVGVDVGTGSCKCVLVDQGARLLGLGSHKYASQSSHGKWQEQDPESIFQAMIASVRAALEQAGELPGEAGGISIGSALHSLVALDENDRPLTGVITWADGRAVEQAQRIKSVPNSEALYQRTGCPVHGMYPLYKIIWLREQRPEVFAKAARFASVKEYILARLCGRQISDYNIAAGSGLLNATSLEWDDLALELAGVKPAQLPELADPRQVLGKLKAEHADHMGLPAGTPLVLGASDAVNSSLGCGSVFPWRATCNIGTSGALRVIVEQPLLDEHARSWCYAVDSGHWLVGGAINNGGLVLSWLRKVINQATADSHIPYERFEQLAEGAEPGAGGLLFLPYLAGERSPNWNLDARGVFFGLSLEHDLRHMTRAVMEGVAFRMRSLNEMLLDLSGELREIRASGGFVESSLWVQILSSVLGRTIDLPAVEEPASLGSAFWAMMADGALGDYADIDRLIGIRRRVSPVEADLGTYDRLYVLYNQVYAALADSLTQIAAFQRGMEPDNRSLK